MKKLLLVAAIVAVSCTSAAFADELKINLGVESGTKTTEVVGADIYARIDGNLTEITVMPDDMAFKMNMKAGPLRLKSGWLTNAKAQKVTTPAE